MASSENPTRKCTRCESTGKLFICSRCQDQSTCYCSPECQKSHWDIHRWNCRPPVVHGIRITCDGERHGSPFEPVVITPKHEIYDYGDVCPVSKVVKFPIVMYRHLKVDPFEIERTAALDNQIATYLMIDVDSGFAPVFWQQCVGTVTVMRKDFKPLTAQAIETIWMYHSHVLDNFGETPGFKPRKFITPAGFRRYCEEYKEEVNGYGTRDDFRDVVLPF